MKHKCKCKQSDLLCNHEKVEYCKECEKVHCLKCGKEWPDEKQEFISYYPYNPLYNPHPIPYYPYHVLLPEPYKPYWEITCGSANGIMNAPDPTIAVFEGTVTTADVQYMLT